MIDEQLFTEMQDLYNENVKLFQQQNTGYLVERILPLTIEDVEKVLDTDDYVDKKYIYEHYVNFTINPQITEIQKGFTTQIELSPDISWEVKK
jgi:hypothetical protein